MGSLSCIEVPTSPLVVTHNRKSIKVVRKHHTNITVDGQCSPSNSAIHIRNLCKSYENIHILDNFCMNVRKGTIYGLLGASGCGKTTVISAIVGTKKFDSGSISVLGDPPGETGRRLGYVPQELGLYDQLSIREMVGFYGCLYEMTNEEVKERLTFLRKLLELPSNSKVIRELSGGQKRRVSLAVALMHRPSLLVLDEPTVGLDPLLRKRVWNYLFKIVKNMSTTVIITTHYIEETRLSNSIGIMRGGRLLVEDSPLNLLRIFNCRLLEDVFLQVSRKDQNDMNLFSSQDNQTQLKFKSNWKANVSSTVRIDYDDLFDGIFRDAIGFDVELNENPCRKVQDAPDRKRKSLKLSSFFQSFQRIRGLTTVMILTFIRHPAFISLILCMPTIHGALTIAAVANKVNGLNFGVINYELMNWTIECDLAKNRENACDFSLMSCTYINKLKQEHLFHLVAFQDETTALEAVQEGRTWGYMVFDRDYSLSTSQLLAAKMFATNESIEGSRIRIHLDYSQFINRFFMIKDLYEEFENYARTVALSCGVNEKVVKVPLHYRGPVYGKYDENYTHFLVPGVITCSLLAVLGILTSVTFITDRKQGTLSRAHVAGLTAADVILSHMITEMLISLSQILLWTTVLYLLFGFEIRGSIWIYLMVTVMTGLSGAGIGMMVGIVCRDEVECLMVGFFWIPIFIFYGGVFWPQEYAIPFWRRVGYILPSTMPIMTLRSVMIRGLGFCHHLVWPGIAVSFTWIVFLLICIVLAYKYRIQGCN